MGAGEFEYLAVRLPGGRANLRPFFREIICQSHENEAYARDRRGRRQTNMPSAPFYATRETKINNPKA